MTIHGAKKGGGKQRQPVIAPDSAQSKTFINIMYGLGEGEIAGLANGYKSVYLDDTPLQNDNGEFNFPNVKVDFRTGTNDQEYIDGFPDVASETAVNVELKHGTPFIKSFNNLDLDALRVRLKWGALRSQNAENGDVNGVKIDYVIDIKTDNGGWIQALTTSINAKTSDAYERSHRIDLPKAQTGWQLRVRRITPNSTSDYVLDKMYISAITEVIDLKLRYPNTALLGLRYDAESFSNVAKMSARCKGLIIKVPTNYNSISRTYTGMWDGQFKMAYSNNPAWVYYDLCTATRYGLGGRLKEYMIDKWSLYRLAQYCDQMVDDGMGGQEPRFTVNVYIQSAEGAFELLSKLAGVFRAISYWDGNSVVLDADIPQDSMYSFSRANVIDGVFEYTGTRARDRHTVAKVAWDNPANHFKTEYEFVRDEKAIAKFGVRVADISAWGCTSRGQAQRAGLWALKSEQLETRMVTFKVGLDGYIPAPAKVIEISDELFAGRATGGRVLAINKAKTVITLDRPITANVGDTLVINGNDGISQRRQISTVNDDSVTVTKPFSDIDVENVWVLDSSELATMKFRVLSVTADDNHQFTITAVQYNPTKYDAIDTGAYIDERPISVINPIVQAPTKSVNLSSYHTTNQGVNVTTLVISWEQVTGAVKYQVEWRKDNGNWQTLPPTGTNSIEIAGVYVGQYEARVTAISAFGQASLATHSNLTQIQGKQGKPNRLAFIRATGVLFGMNLAWGFAANSDDTNFTEIQISPDGRSNITTLGKFAYPTNKHEITGLQGNLTQFYRARIVDKLGNTSDWTNWVSGTTSADAAKVLDLISGQISESHLDQTLRTPIGKIDTLGNSVQTLNNSITAAQRDLKTAATNITTERNRISTAIRDIATLQSASNAKTTDIANLTNTVNGHTSSIRELGVTTGDLSQKYTVLKTANDSANSEVTAIKQTQSGQATQLNTIKTTADKATADLRTTKQTLANADTALGQRIDSLQSDYNSNKANIANQIKTLSDKDVAAANQISNLTANFTTANNKADAAKRTADDALGKANTANTAITAEQKARADADNSLVSRITALDAAYKKADTDMTARVAREETARADADKANAQAVKSLESTVGGINGRVGTAESKIGTLERTTSDTKQALATAQNQLNARFDNLKIGGRNLLLHTEKLNQLWRVASFDGQTTMTVNNGIAVITGKNNGWKHLGYDISLSKAQELLQTDTNFTLSVYIRRVSGANNPINIALRKGITNGFIDHLVGGNVTPTNTWVRYIVKGTMAADDLKYFFVRFEWSDNSVYEFKQPKLEFGLHVTGWTPAPEDTNALIETTQANLNEFKQTQATKDSANSQKLTQLQASLNTVDNRTKWQEINTVTDLNNLKEQGNYFIKQSNNPNAPTANWIYITVDKANNARIRQTVWADNYAHQRFTRLWTDNRWHNWEQTPSSADVNNKASASALNDLKTTVNNVNNKVTAEANKTNQLQTNLNNQTNKITEQTRSIDGIKAIKAVTVDNNGVLSGYGLISELQNGRITSKFGINADQFYIGNPNNNKKLFNVYTTPQNINGVTIPAGTYLDSAFIAKGSINMLHISDSIQSDNYVANKTGWKLFKNGRFEINGTSNNGARLVINNTGLTIYYNGNQKALELSIEL